MNRTTRVGPLNHPVKDELRTCDGAKPKDIHDTVGSAPGLSLLYHQPEPQQNERAETAQKMRQKMTESSWNMFGEKEQRNEDWMTGSTKRSQQNNMFQTSQDIFGDKAHAPAPMQKKQSKVKTDEINGTNLAKLLSDEEMDRYKGSGMPRNSE